MNWVDLTFAVLLAAGAIIGLRMRLIGATVIVIGGLIGWLLAGRLSHKVGGLFGDFLSADTFVTIISYIIIVAVALLVARWVAKIVRSISAIATLGLSGMVDRLGGLALGALLGIVVAGAFLIVMARATYNFELPDEGMAGTVASREPKVEDTRMSIENALDGSAVAPVFVRAMTHLPGDALGFVPDDFMVALEILERRIEGQ